MSESEFIELYLNANDEIRTHVENLLINSQQQLEYEPEH